MRRLVPFLTLLMIAACDCGGTTQKQSTPIIVVSIPGAPDATQQDTALAFDESCLKNDAVTPITRALTLKNSGRNVLTLKSLEITGASKASFTITGTKPTSVDTLGEAKIEIAFAPVTAGNQSASLVIESDDPVKPSLSVRLTGTGSSRPQSAAWETKCLLSDGGVDGDTTCRFLNFADTSIGSSSKATIQVGSNGCPPLQITDVQIVYEDTLPPDSGPIFKLVGPAPSATAPVSIAGGTKGALEFEFNPVEYQGNTTWSAIAVVTTNGTGDNSAQPSPTGVTLTPQKFAARLIGTGFQPQIALIPQNCDFNDANSLCHPATNGTNIDATFTIRNSGGGAANVTALTLTPSRPNVFTLNTPTLPLVVPGGQERTFTVRYSKLNGFATGRIELLSSGGSATATLQAGNPPHLVAQPCAASGGLDLPFGDETQNSYSATQDLCVSNTGSGDLSLAKFEFVNLSAAQGDGGCPNFFPSPAPSFPVSLPSPNGQRTFTIAHRPEAVGGFSACTMRIQSDDPSYPSPLGYELTLTAKTYVNCKPVGVLTPLGTSGTLAISRNTTDGGIIFSGAGSYDPGIDSTHPTECPSGKSQGVVRYRFSYNVDPNSGADNGELQLLPGGVGTCTRRSSNNKCLELLVVNSGDRQNPTPEASSAQLALDPTKNGAYSSVEIRVIDGTNLPDGGGFLSDTAGDYRTSLNISP